MEVILHTTHCPKCNVVEHKLQSKDVEYTVNENVDEMVRKGLKEAPALEVDGKIMPFTESINWINSIEVQG